MLSINNPDAAASARANCLSLGKIRKMRVAVKTRTGHYAILNDTQGQITVTNQCP